MARGTPAFTSGTLTAVGSGQTKALGQTLRAHQDWSPTSGTGARIDTLTLIRMEAA